MPFVVLSLYIFFSSCIAAQNAGLVKRPDVVHIGALVAYDSTIGKVAKKAIELALEDVNVNSSVLNGTRLVLTMIDTNCSAFLGTAAAMELMKKDVAAVVGPQSSVLARVVSNMANELQIPLLSFAATDPTLSSYQYPYFFRMAHNDSSQMTAIAAFIGYYNWGEVVAIYIDDDYGRNGMSVLDDELRNVGARIVHKAVLRPGASRSDMVSVLVQLVLMESRVLVVHMNPDAGLKLFSEAKQLQMLNTGYVWIATDWLSSAIDSDVVDSDTMSSLQGVIGLRRHIPLSVQLRAFTLRWNNLLKAKSVETHLNVFGLYAYDTVWAIAQAMDTFLSEGGNITFGSYPQLFNASGKNSELARLKVFREGPKLLQILSRTNFTGLIGPVQLTQTGDLLNSTFEIINIAGTGFRKVSYWSSQSGLSVSPPESNQSRSGKQLYDVIWPGESKLVPRGWVFPNDGRQLVVGVPRKTGFRVFVETINGTNMMKGFCIDVFTSSLKLLPYAVPFAFNSFGNGKSTPSYDQLVEQVVFKKFDAAVGDISIVTNRSKNVDFTQPYIDSGLVVIAPTRKNNSNNAWAFLQPFTPSMWYTTGAFFIVIGAVVWILEHKTNPEFRGLPKQQIVTILWFSFSTLFFSHRENTMSTLGRAVIIVWMFVVLIITSSYTASLTSILTVQQLSPTIKGIDSLIVSDTPIGYQTGSFARNYLTEELGIAASRLIPLESTRKYAEALSLGPSNGGVAAIVDELPYAQYFLSTQCGFAIVGQQFTRSGWGFAFPKGSQLAIDMSTAILTLSENGELQRIHDKWLSQISCTSDDDQLQSNQLGLKSFWGLFLITGVASFIAIVVFLCRRVCEFIRHPRNSDNEDSNVSASHSIATRSARVLRSFASFIDEKEIDEREKKKLKRKQMEKQASVGDGSSHASTFSPGFSASPFT